MNMYEMLHPEMFEPFLNLNNHELINVHMNKHTCNVRYPTSV